MRGCAGFTCQGAAVVSSRGARKRAQQRKGSGGWGVLRTPRLPRSSCSLCTPSYGMNRCAWSVSAIASSAFSGSMRCTFSAWVSCFRAGVDYGDGGVVVQVVVVVVVVVVVQVVVVVAEGAPLRGLRASSEGRPCCTTPPTARP